MANQKQPPPKRFKLRDYVETLIVFVILAPAVAGASLMIAFYSGITAEGRVGLALLSLSVFSLGFLYLEARINHIQRQRKVK